MADTQFQFIPHLTAEQEANAVNCYIPLQISGVTDSCYSTKRGFVDSTFPFLPRSIGNARVEFEAGMTGIDESSSLEITLKQLVELGKGLGLAPCPGQNPYGSAYLNQFVGQQVQVAYLDGEFLSFKVPASQPVGKEDISQLIDTIKKL